MAENQLEVVHCGSAPKVRLIETIFDAAIIEKRLWYGLQVDERATKENSIRVLKHT